MMKTKEIYDKKEIKKILPILEKVESYRIPMSKLTDKELKDLTYKFQLRLMNGETTDSILPEAFAAIREADRRVLGKEPYKVQVLGAIVLHQGKIAELKTGEGKTLLGTMPAYLNALTREGVHVVTVNEYLAKRDSDEMRKVHEFMGLTVGCVTSDMTKEERQEAYGCDITYVTNSEVGFDYLRDNMVKKKSDRVQGKLAYAIIDEIDSVLIDEARTPLIISTAKENNNLIYGTCNILAKQMEEGVASAKFNKSDAIMGKVIEETGDFIIDKKDKTVTLTPAGTKKAETFLHVKNISSPENRNLYHCLLTALRANHLMKRDKDYVVKDGEVLIVDEFTGRIMDGRRYSDGLHQAIEAKERVEIKKESETQATITYQNFFNKYKKKCGMTGTGATERDEFKEIYGLDVVVVPTNKPVIRKDLEDLVFKTNSEKFDAVCDAIAEAYDKRQPVLVGVTSVEKSEKLSKLLSKKGLPHFVLNAKNDALEAEIIAKAGEAGKITVATNMAGRGTDIKLDEDAIRAGGLKVIGTERNESIRIDNQLRGRSGRQGDPGESQFYLSLEDELLKFYAKEKWMVALKQVSLPKGEPLKDSRVLKAVRLAQESLEENNFGIRKQVFEYDSVNNQHREFIYRERNRILSGENVHDVYQRAAKFIADKAIEKCIVGTSLKSWDLITLNREIATKIPVDVFVSKDANDKNRKQFVELIQNRVASKVKEQKNRFEPRELVRYEQQVLLSVIDKHWVSHLEALDHLKQWIGVQAYGQKDPRFEYKRLANSLLDDMISDIYHDIIKEYFR